MGSQMIVDSKWGSVLGHPYNLDQIKVGYWQDFIAPVSLGTSTTKTKLGGTQVVGTAADYIIPTAARCIVAVRPKLYGTTPTANQAVLATLKIESQDLGMKDFEVFCNPIDSGLGTAEMQMVDKAQWWPLMQPCYGGERMQFFGTAQIANTVAVYEAVDLLLSDTPPEGFNAANGSWMQGYGAIQGKIAGINSGGGPTATGTAALSIGTDSGLNISTPRKRIIDLVGVVVGTTPAASKPVGGNFYVNASELAINPQRWIAEPITGFLGTSTTGQQAHLSEAGPLNLVLRSPSNLKGNFALDLAITTAGNFEVGYIYIDYP